MTAVPAKLVCVLAATGVGGAAIAGCGNEVPANSVAKVGDTVIKKSEFDKWLKTAATGQAEGGQAVVPDPPRYSRCVAGLRTQPQPGGGRQASVAQLRKQCKQRFDQLKGEVMQFLIQSQWVQQEAEKQGVKVTDAEVRRSFEDQKKQAFPTDKAYKEFLRGSGMSEQDILFRVKLDVLQQKLTQKVTEKESKVTDADVKEYYEKNKKRFAQPERRDLRVVLTKTERKAEQAKRQLRRGRSWRSVAKRFSIDQASKAQGGRLPDVAKGQQEKALDTAVFRARRGRIEGPVKTQFGYYVFEVEKVSKASQQSLEQAKETIKNLLRSQRQQKALDSFIKRFREDYKEQTNCADDFKVAECKNAPKEKQTGPASGGQPGGGAPAAPGSPQGAPQGTPPGGAPQQGAPPGPPQQGAPQPQPQAPPQP